MSSLHSRLLDDAEEAAALAAQEGQHGQGLGVGLGHINGPPHSRNAILRTAPQPVLGRTSRSRMHTRDSSHESVAGSSSSSAAAALGRRSSPAMIRPRGSISGSSGRTSGSPVLGRSAMSQHQLQHPMGNGGAMAQLGGSLGLGGAHPFLLGSSTPRSVAMQQAHALNPSSRQRSGSNAHPGGGVHGLLSVPAVRRGSFGFGVAGAGSAPSVPPTAGGVTVSLSSIVLPTAVQRGAHQSSVHSPPPDPMDGWQTEDDESIPPSLQGSPVRPGKRQQHHAQYPDLSNGVQDQPLGFGPEGAESFQNDGGLVAGSDFASDAASAPLKSLPRPLRGYFIGQLSNVLKLGIWWTVFGPLLLSLFHGHVYGISLSRIAFNTALMISSPLAAILVERVCVRRILLGTVATRGVIYVLLLPLVYLLLETDWITPHVDTLDDSDYRATATFPLLMTLFFLLIFLDGLVVAASNIVDIDCDGVALVARQHAQPLLQGVRQVFAQRHEQVFESSMIILAPVLAILAQAVCGLFKDYGVCSSPTVTKHLSAPVLLFTLSFVFLLCTVVSLVAYGWGIPRLTRRQFQRAMRAEETVTAEGAVVYVLPPIMDEQTGQQGQGQQQQQQQHHRGSDAGPHFGTFAQPSPTATASASSSIPVDGGLDGPLGSNVGGGAPGFSDALAGADDDGDDMHHPPARRSVCAEMGYMVRMLRVGARLCWSCPPIRSRLWMLAMQTGVEDAVISVLLPVVSTMLLTRSLAHPNAGSGENSCYHGQASVLAIGLIALGKLSGLLMTRLRNRGWVSPERMGAWVDLKSSRFIPLSILASTLCVALTYSFAPLLLQTGSFRWSALWNRSISNHFDEHGHESHGVAADAPLGRIVASVSLVALGTSVFFILSSFPKFLLASGIQQAAEHLLAEVENHVAERERRVSFSSSYSETSSVMDGAGDVGGAPPPAAAGAVAAAADENTSIHALNGGQPLPQSYGSPLHPHNGDELPLDNGDDNGGDNLFEQVDIGGVRIDRSDVSRSLFGFVAAWLTLLDSLLLLSLALIFAAVSGNESDIYSRGLLLVGALLAFHGLFVFVGSMLGRCGASHAVDGSDGRGMLDRRVLGGFGLGFEGEGEEHEAVGRQGDVRGLRSGSLVSEDYSYLHPSPTRSPNAARGGGGGGSNHASPRYSRSGNLLRDTIAAGGGGGGGIDVPGSSHKGGLHPYSSAPRRIDSDFGSLAYPYSDSMRDGDGSGSYMDSQAVSHVSQSSILLGGSSAAAAAAAAGAAGLAHPWHSQQRQPQQQQHQQQLQHPYHLHHHAHAAPRHAHVAFRSQHGGPGSSQDGSIGTSVEPSTPGLP